jgi:hypothetical protein
MAPRTLPKQTGVKRGALRVALSVLVSFGAMNVTDVALATGTAHGEIQGRPAPVYRCPSPSLPCADPNVFNISVAVHYNASAADLTTIQNSISGLSAVLFDLTDGQAHIGEAFIYNNAFGTNADIRVYPSSSPTWWYANTGQWQVGGSAHASINYISAAGADVGEYWGHEFTHLVFDARDEYESRAVGCGSVLGSAHCPDAATQALGEDPCIMEGGGTEYCWGHGNPANPADLSGGNHDADLVTEQSRCRSNRSCWEQVVWSWPDHFVMPAGAPDPAAMGATVPTTHFVMVDDTMRVVLVLDESGSMSLESPTRMERLKVAANDFVTLAENGTELGIVSFSTDANPASGHASVAIAALGAVRTTWTNAINGLSPGGATNIGDGLQRARTMIMTAGGVTANTFIVLMTDGVNNQPWPDPAAHLNGVLADLLADGIPVYVTCTGGDLGLSSQCSEIATATGGFYVDSADAADLPQSFTDFHERISGREAIDSESGTLLKSVPTKIFVEEGSESATFTLMWQDEKAAADMVIIDPAGGQHSSLPMPQGRYARIGKPTPGEWEMIIDPRGVDSAYVVRAYTRNAIQSLTAAVRQPVVLPGKDIYVYAYPRSIGGGVTNTKETIMCTVLLPNGEMDTMELHDRGPDANGEGDDLPEDGIFTGVYKNTKLKGPYRFHLRADIEKWSQSTDRSRYDSDLMSPHFVREARVSAAVGEPGDIPPRTIESIRRVEKAVRIAWYSEPDVKYTVNFSEDPNDRGKPVSTVVGNGGLVEWFDDGSETGSNPDDPRVLQRYYRISRDQ